MKLDATQLEIIHALRLAGFCPAIPYDVVIRTSVADGETARVALNPEDKSGRAFALVTRNFDAGKFAVQFSDDADARSIVGAYVVIDDSVAAASGLHTDLSAGEVHLKLSRIGKRADVRAWPIRDTIISRWYHGRAVKRKIKADSFPLTGSMKTTMGEGGVYIHVDYGNPAGIPTATWLLTAADFTWEVYCPVDVDAGQSKTEF